MSFRRLAWGLAAAGVAGTGCATGARPIFEAQGPRMAWPDARRTPRIEFVGSLSTSADLKPERGWLEGLIELLGGREDPVGLVAPRAVAVTRDGKRVWIADPGGRGLFLFDLSRRTHLKIETVGEHRLVSPVGVCLGPADTIFVCDSQGTGLYQLSDRTGRLVRRWRLPSDVQRPVALAFDPSAHELFVVDVRAHDIKVLGPQGELIRVLGGRGNAAGEFNFPSAITLAGGALWVADTGNHRVQAVSSRGAAVRTFGQAGDAPGDLALPKGIACDADGHVYVVDGRFENVQVFDARGRLLLYFGEEGHGAGQFWLPGDVFVEPGGRIWVTDSYNKRVQVFQYLRGTSDGR